MYRMCYRYAGKEEEALEIVRQELSAAEPPRNLAAAIRARIGRLGGVELELPPHEPMRDPPRFDRPVSGKLFAGAAAQGGEI